ncbi:MAG TPA: FUSC family protein [Acidimicrobiales bacterium]|nr:FUSC family protein [Acidimicrobiales bacterium]
MSRKSAAPGAVDANGAGPPLPFASSRPHPFRSLVQLAPGQPAYGLGVRMAILITVPMIVGAAVHEIGPATVISIGTLNSGMADAGGARISRWHAFGAATVLLSLAMGLGTVAARPVGLAVALTFVVMAGCAFANLFGNVASNVGFVTSVVFIMGVGLGGSGSVALERMWLVAVGGALATIVTLVLWPVRPYVAASASLSGCYRSIAGVVRSLLGGPAGPSGTDPAEMTRAAEQARDQIDEARSIVTLTRAGRHGASVISTRLLTLLVRATSLLSTAEGTAALTTGAFAAGDDRAPVDEALAALAASVERLAAVVEHQGVSNRNGVDVDLVGLDNALTEALGWAMLTRTSTTFEQTAALRPVLDALSAMVALVHASVGVLQGGSEEPAAQGADLESLPTGTVRRRSWRGRLGAVGRTARANLTPDSVIFRHAVRYGTATSAGVAIAWALHLTRGYWVPVTAAVVLRPFAATTVQRTLLRVAGTVAGGIIAVAVVSGTHSPVGLIAALFVCSAVAFALLPLNYAWAVVFLTPTVIVLISAAAPGGWSVTADRVLNTLLGAAIALVVGFLLWPTAERRAFPDALAAALLAVRGHLDRVLDAYLGPPPGHQGPSMAVAHQQAGLAVDNAQAGFQRLLGGNRIRHVAQTGTLWSITDASRYLFLETSALENHLDLDHGTQAPASVDDVRRLCDQMLAELADALGHRRPVRSGQFPLEELHTAVTAIRRTTDQARAERRSELSAGTTGLTPAALQVRYFGSVSTALDHIAAALDHLEGTVDDMAGHDP